jgi:gamma-glutamyltranspeptidase / glutathione hydrolase
VVLCETLNLLFGWPVNRSEFHAAQQVHWLTEALRRAFHDRNLELGDPDFVHADVARLISPAYADGLRPGIDPDHATPSATLGGVGAGTEGKSTTHLSIVDDAGNAVSLTYTLNDWFGARVVAKGTGILLNDEMDDFSAKPGASNMYGLVEGENNAIAPGKRPLSSMTPTIVTRGRPLEDGLGYAGWQPHPHRRIADHAQPDRLSHELDGGGLRAADPRAMVARYLVLRKRCPERRHACRPDGEGHQLEPMPYWNQVAAILVDGPALDKPSSGKEKLFGVIDPRLPVGSVAGY